ncbi:MAG: glycoside hydrolase family 2 protein, partial [Huintestinicola sp.]
MKQSLNGAWTLTNANKPETDIPVSVPGTVLGALIDAGLAGDPYYGENEYKTTPLFEDPYVFSRPFSLDDEIIDAHRILIKFYGIDTLSRIFVNGNEIGRTDNMHREYVFDITDNVLEDNILEVRIDSPLQYISEKNRIEPLWGVSSTISGYPHLRKAHYMFGWDWGPKLPDMGIWRDVELIGVTGGLISGFYIRQDHSDVSEGKVKLAMDMTLSHLSDELLTADITVISPDEKEILHITEDMSAGESKRTFSAEINGAQLWYPAGYGAQPLYKVITEIFRTENGQPADRREDVIGLRTVTISRDTDDEGEGFAFEVNGTKIFAMGANYIPEDQILSRRSRQKTEKLLTMCRAANFNMIRVWGGGIYPDDYFYEICDRLGLLVWQDFMFACSVYKADLSFCETVKRELIDNIKRIRNHPCLALWCGNNEIESMWQYWNIDSDPKYKKDYLRLFEALIPKVLDFYDPVTYYHPSSPSSGGGFNDSGAVNRGDQHYWDVWHGLKPFTEYFRYNFRFCSEFGFESLPSMKTIRTFAEDNDLNLCSPVMETHQKCEQGTEKIMYYLAQMSHYPYDFEGLVYATQMVQADAIRLNVENMRRRRGVCMGSLYWQVNDSNPVISWSSVDYYHRPKALHYHAKHFYAPVLVSADTRDMSKIRLNISSERAAAFGAELRWASRTASGEIIAQSTAPVRIEPFSAADVALLTPENTGITEDMRDKAYIEYSLLENGIRVSGGTCMLVRPKAFRFKAPHLSMKVVDMGSRYTIEVSAEAFAKGVCIESKDIDCI